MWSNKMGVPQHRIFNNSTLKNMDDCTNNNFLRNAELTLNNISEFYADSKIFITGATGFVGKALVEKLLRSCEKVDAIFLLVRPKKGITVELRIKELFKNPVFDRIRDKNPEAFEKVKVIPGDVALPNLGLSDADKQFLIDNIDIVYHSAATVKFNEALKNAVILNTLGTKRVLDLCKKMNRLKCCVHISTVFCNSDKETIEEMVYQSTYDAYTIMNLVENLPEDVIESISNRLVGKHPNTYTFTKALAEQIVQEYSSELPLAIVRPSIITSAWKEPYPGWVDNVSGITGILMECGRGTIKTIICDDRRRMELVPVDMVVNTLIAAAWHTVAHRSTTMRVYNCTSGKLNPILWREFGRHTQKHAIVWPSKYVTWYPGFTYRTSRTMHVICAGLFHFVPSAILDSYLYCTGQKPMMFRLSKKFYQALEAGSFFSTHEWEFKLHTMRSLVEAVRLAEDGKKFETDLSADNGFDWDIYIGDFLRGIRRFVLKDDDASLAAARVKLNRLYWFQRIFQIMSAYLALKMAMSYF
ncbi:putative fatty acyl-CoA reductase CG5065 isoform X2 [Cylas formicarius]|uniref:putative fatty acyl-CoA reductase CG5065 isoform X2 n=1 Tax=Cylas formicarius TaxID=197179 RepID=UPI002958C1DB|nr:putative fatty acyl-CoA reductase CG5065 isoform X2 [Cylas formicarius]